MISKTVDGFLALGPIPDAEVYEACQGLGSPKSRSGRVPALPILRRSSSSVLRATATTQVTADTVPRTPYLIPGMSSAKEVFILVHFLVGDGLCSDQPEVGLDFVLFLVHGLDLRTPLGYADAVTQGCRMQVLAARAAHVFGGEEIPVSVRIILARKDEPTLDYAEKYLVNRIMPQLTPDYAPDLRFT